MFIQMLILACILKQKVPKGKGDVDTKVKGPKVKSDIVISKVPKVNFKF
jgi:hypothetical protein